MHKLQASRRAILQSTGAALGATLFAPRAVAAQDRVLYVNTWGGSWTEAEQAAYFKPFSEKTGIRIGTVAPVSFAKLKAQVEAICSKSSRW